MKQFLFFNSNFYAKNESFIKSKEGYLVSVNFTCKIFPNFINDFYIIVNIIFNDDKFSNIKNNPNNNNNKTINTLNNKSIHSYSFFLGSDFEFYGLTKNFYLEYYLNQNMFRKLKLNFCQFFCINKDELTKQIKKEKTKLKEYNNLKQKIPLKEINKAYTIFQNIEVKKAIKLRDEKILANYFYPPIYIYDIIDKNNLVKKIPEMIKIIDELGLNYEWYLILEDFKERLTDDNFQNKKQTGIVKKIPDRLNSFLNEDIKNLKNTTICNLNNLDLIIKNKIHYFEVVYIIKKISSIEYYIVNLYEKIKSSLGQTRIYPKILNNPILSFNIKDERGNNSPKQKNLISQTSNILEEKKNEKKKIIHLKNFSKQKTIFNKPILKGLNFKSKNINIDINKNDENNKKEFNSKKSFDTNLNEKLEKEKENENDNDNNIKKILMKNLKNFL